MILHTYLKPGAVGPPVDSTACIPGAMRRQAVLPATRRGRGLTTDSWGAVEGTPGAARPCSSLKSRYALNTARTSNIFHVHRTCTYSRFMLRDPAMQSCHVLMLETVHSRTTAWLVMAAEAACMQACDVHIAHGINR